MSDFYVYIIHDSTGVPVYVGKGSGKRSHQTKGKRNAKIEGLISFGGTLPSVKVRENLTEAEAFDLEKALIAFHGREDLGLGPLLNLNDGGPGGENPAAETRAKMSEAHSGKEPTAQTREKIAAALKGRPKSAEHIAKHAAALRGRKLSPE